MEEKESEYEKEIKEQLTFVDWLKNHGIYDPMERAVTMQKMFTVWKLAKMEDVLVRPSIDELVDS